MGIEKLLEKEDWFSQVLDRSGGWPGNTPKEQVLEACVVMILETNSAGLDGLFWPDRGWTPEDHDKFHAALLEIGAERTAADFARIRDMIQTQFGAEPDDEDLMNFFDSASLRPIVVPAAKHVDEMENQLREWLRNNLESFTHIK